MHALQYPKHMDVQRFNNSTVKPEIEASDEELMMAYAHNNDQQAFATLYTRHKASLYRYCARMLGNEALGAELYQDAWSKVIKARTRYQVKAKFKTYLFHVAHNLIIDQWRKNRPDMLSIDDEEVSHTGNELQSDTNLMADLLSTEQLERFKEAVLELPPMQRDVVLLHYDHGLTLKQIAECEGVTRETIKSRLRYAVKKLKKIFADTDKQNIEFEKQSETKLNSQVTYD